MNSTILTVLVIAGLLIALAFLFGGFGGRGEFALPQGDSLPLATSSAPSSESLLSSEAVSGEAGGTSARSSARTISVTNGTKHSIPLEEILSGGPGKDGIPSIDAPAFWSKTEADDFLGSDDPGIGLTLAGESRFYPYRILVWHEIVNDTVGGKPVLVTYCPLCATGIVFERLVDGVPQEFGVSGRLWQSNLLMYNRAGTEKEESLWSQVLGEAVVGIHTGAKLTIVPSDITRWSDWKKAHPETTVLSTDTGASRNYGRDPYGDYYTSESVSFGATFRDTRLHPKALVHGIELKGKFKAYSDEALKAAGGEIKDSFAGAAIRAIPTNGGGVRFEAEGKPLPSIPGFWFSWIAVHPETELYQ